MRATVADTFLTPSRLFHGALNQKEMTERRGSSRSHRRRAAKTNDQKKSVHRALQLDSTEFGSERLPSPHINSSDDDEDDNTPPRLTLPSSSEGCASKDGLQPFNNKSSRPGADREEGGGDDEDEMDPRLSAKIEHFCRIPRLIPDLEFFFRYSTCAMFDCLLGSLFTPLKIILLPNRIDRRDVITIFYTLVGIVTYYLCAYPDSAVLYSTLYHAVRTTATIKLYLLFSILEVSDKLLTSLTSDSLEVLYACTKRRTSPSRQNWFVGSRTVIAGTFCVSVLAVALHSLVLLLHVVTLNVAINSEGNSLMALLISNNFVEVKSVVFKKYVPETLLQNVCADALERLQLAVFVYCIIAQHVLSEGFGMLEWQDVVLVLMCELLIDFIKHYFVATFNNVSLAHYRMFSQLLLFDVATQEFLWSLDPSRIEIVCEDGALPQETIGRLASPAESLVPNPARRCGFVPMPYLALMCWCAFPVIAQGFAGQYYLRLCLALAAVVAVKLLVHAYLVGNAQRFVVRSLLTERNSNSNTTNDATKLPSLHLRRRQTLQPLSDDVLSANKTLFGVSPQMTPAKRKGLQEDTKARRCRSMPSLLSSSRSQDVTEEEDGGNRVTHVLFITKQLANCIPVERFDLNAGKSKASALSAQKKDELANTL